MVVPAPLVITVSPRDLVAVTIFDKRYGRAVKGKRGRHNPKQRVDSLIRRSGRARVTAHRFRFVEILSVPRAGERGRTAWPKLRICLDRPRSHEHKLRIARHGAGCR